MNDRCEQCGGQGRVIESRISATGARNRRIECRDCGYRWTIRGGQWRVPGARRIVCVETGEEFPSALAAACATGTTANSVRGALRKGCRGGGFHWREV